MINDYFISNFIQILQLDLEKAALAAIDEDIAKRQSVVLDLKAKSDEIGIQAISAASEESSLKEEQKVCSSIFLHLSPVSICNLECIICNLDCVIVFQQSGV